MLCVKIAYHFTVECRLCRVVMQQVTIHCDVTEQIHVVGSYSRTMLAIHWRRDRWSAAFGRKAVSGISRAGRLCHAEYCTSDDGIRLRTANTFAHVIILLDVDRHWSLVCTNFCTLSHTVAYPAAYIWTQQQKIPVSRFSRRGALFQFESWNWVQYFSQFTHKQGIPCLLESWSLFVTLSCASDETSVVASHSFTSASTFLRVASTLWHSPSWLKHLKSCNVCLNQPLTVLRCTRTLYTTTFYVSNKQEHKY